MAVNLKGTFLAAKAALGPMRRNGYGRMVFTSSITGPRVTSPGHGHYSATKAGINGFIKSAALEFSGDGITVNGVEPGNILTEGMQASRSPEFMRMMEQAVPLGRLGTPREIAHTVLFLASDEAAYITGTTIIVDGGRDSTRRPRFQSQALTELRFGKLKPTMSFLAFDLSMAVLHGSVGERTEPTPCLCLSDADGLRASKLKHAVQGMNGDGDLRRATPIRPRAQRIPDHSFEAADGGLHQGPTSVPGPLLPAHASMLGDALEMPIALGRSGLHILAQHRR